MDKNKQEELKKIMQDLEEGIKNVFTSKNYKEFLKTMSKFHRYSTLNIIWLQKQMPNASLIAGYKTWKEMGRNVKAKEKALRVIAPMVHKTIKKLDKISPVTGKPTIGKNGEIEKENSIIEWISYRAVPVFDISQTEGKELPKLVENLKGNVDNYNILKGAIEDICKVPIRFENINDTSNGFFDLISKEIVIKNNLSEVQTLKTMLHELTHSRLHDYIDDRYKLEVEAESTAFVVSNFLGIDTSDYSFNYIASWSKDKELNELKGSLNLIKETASKIISEIEESIEKGINKEQEKEYPYIKIEWSENNKFKDGQELSILKANEIFKNEEIKIRNLKKEFEKKGEYYGYEKVKANFYISSKKKIIFRYDIGDGYANDLIDFFNKEYNLDIKPKIKDKSLNIENTTKSINTKKEKGIKEKNEINK